MARFGRRYPFNRFFVRKALLPAGPTRLYLPSTGTAAVSPAFRSGWEDTTTGSPARRILVATPSESAMTTKTLTLVDFPPGSKQYLLGQWVSPPLDGAQSVGAGTVQAAIRGIESSAGGDAFVAWAAYVVSNDGTTVRGVIQDVAADNTELATSLTNRHVSATGSSVSALHGDRIVVELGIDTAVSLDGTYSLRIGDSGAADLPFDDSTIFDFNPFIEFAQALVFGPEVTGYTISADSASWVWSGTAASLERGFAIAAESASWVWTGTDVAIKAARSLSAESASWVWAGSDVALTYLQANVLLAESASWIWTGGAVDLEAARKLTAESASWVWTGGDVTISTGKRLSAESASWLWTAFDADLVPERLLNAESALWVWNGSDVDLIYVVPPILVDTWKKAIDDSNWEHAGYLQGNWRKAILDSNWKGRP